MYNYSFHRQEEDEPTGATVSEDLQTNLRGLDPTLDQVLSGFEVFVPACGFDLQGSGIGLVPKD
tara:strand:+ start:1578 stop:1769 length:192 start_codon:yes stop_codon:yes gene_type:complete